jgi:hypothetical protein
MNAMATPASACLGAVDRRLARAEQVAVGAVDEQDLHDFVSALCSCAAMRAGALTAP